MYKGFLFAWFAVGCAGQVEPNPPPAGDDDDDDTDTDDTDDTDTPVEPPAEIRVVINEVMADNESSVNGPDGVTFPDWVEIANVGEETVPWSRLGLRNAEGVLWEGSQGEIAAGAHAILWADEALELGFGLDKEHDEITLLLDGVAVDTVAIDDLGGDLSIARTPDLTGDFVQTAWTTPGVANESEASPTLNVADETVFTTRFVHQIEFTFTPGALDQIDRPARPEVHVGVAVDGVFYEDIGLKLKGSASYDTMDGKPAFLVDLNEWVSGTKFRGLKAFKLHNGNVLDPTRVHDYLTYQLARESGLLAPRVGWAEVYCNGVYFGIYMVIEKHDDEFIAYRKPDQEDIGVILEPNEGFGDFGNSWADMTAETINLSWEEGPLPPDPLVIDALLAVDDLVGRQANDANVTAFWEHVEKDAFLDYLAWETLVMHTDGYRSPNNWRVFVDGTTHQVQWVPSGAEWTWDADIDVFPAWGGQALGWCLGNQGCRYDYAVQVLEMADRVETLDLATQFEDLSFWLDPLIQSDPRYQPLWGTIASSRQSTIQHLAQNPDRARSQVYAEFPELEP